MMVSDLEKRFDWMVAEANELERHDEDWPRLEPYFLALISLFRRNHAFGAAFTATFIDCAVGRRQSPYPLVPYCMRELRLGGVRAAIVAEAQNHVLPDQPAGHDEYYARHMSHWSYIHSAFDEAVWHDDDLWRYHSARQWLVDRTSVPGLRRVLVRSQLNMGSAAEAVSWAEGSLASGADCPSLRVLAGLPQPVNGFEVAALLEAVRSETRDEAGSTDDAVGDYFVQLALECLSGVSDLDDGLREGLAVATRVADADEVALWSAADNDLSLARDGVTSINEALIRTNERLLSRVARALS